ncbi:MAG: MBL fold metallo-hydrolase [Candidatus Omnitrophica bacterium]|jgi:glyoxylase-like metal-dependent hydrolase (beta-lactamase superfamily II)|nr:MBL fold metallo-hydrolase [Candidatus Omnitrophota bacterium]
MLLETIVVGELQVNCYILAESTGSQAVIIDPGDDYAKVSKALCSHKLKPGIVINTHGHMDHIGLDGEFGAPVYIHKLDAGMLKDPVRNMSNFFGQSFSIAEDVKIITFEDKEEIGLGKIRFKVLHTPGHTPGGTCFFLELEGKNLLFSGDSLFYRSIGRSDLPGANEKVLINAIKNKLLVLPAQTLVYPGHGPSTTIGEEIKNNPFLN